MDHLFDNPIAFSTAALVFAVSTFRLLAIPYLESRKPFDDIHVCPKSHWLFGHAAMTNGRDSFPESHLYVYNNTDENGRVAYWLVTKRCIGFKNIKDARHILKVESQRTRVPIIGHYIGKVIGTKNLLFLNGREWKQNRDAVTRTFVHSFLVQSQQDVYQVTQDLIATLKRKMEGLHEPLELDMLPVMKMVTSDVIGKAAFGVDFDCCKTLTNSTIIGAFEYMMNDMSARAENPILPWNYFFFLPLDFSLSAEVDLPASFLAASPSSFFSSIISGSSSSPSPDPTEFHSGPSLLE